MAEESRDALTRASIRAETIAERDEWPAGSQTTGPRIGRVSYSVLIAAILLAEFPLNAIAFRLFGESEVLTWVMTAGLAATLILCAHGLGAFLLVPHPTMADRRWVIVLLVLPTLAIVGVAIIRERYLSVAAGRILAIERCWQGYFERSGARWSPERFGAALVRFP